jgi:hypothetical protein
VFQPLSRVHIWSSAGISLVEKPKLGSNWQATSLLPVYWVQPAGTADGEVAFGVEGFGAAVFGAGVFGATLVCGRAGAAGAVLGVAGAVLCAGLGVAEVAAGSGLELGDDRLGGLAGLVRVRSREAR